MKKTEIETKNRPIKKTEINGRDSLKNIVAMVNGIVRNSDAARPSIRCVMYCF